MAEDRGRARAGGGAAAGGARPAAAARVQRPEARPALGLEELLDLLVRGGDLAEASRADVLARATTLRSRVLKERVGSVRSQAAARYDVSPAEIVAAANLPHPRKSHRRLDEDAIAEALAQASGTAYQKIDPLRIESQLVAKTLSRPFARHHVVIPLARDSQGLLLAIADPFDAALRDQLEGLLPEPLRYAVAAKSDIVAVIDRVYGFRSQVSQAERELGPDRRGGKLVQMVELRSNEEASASDAHVIAAVDYLLNY